MLSLPTSGVWNAFGLIRLFVRVMFYFRKPWPSTFVYGMRVQ